MKELTCAVCKKPADYILHNKYGQPLNICKSCYKYIWESCRMNEKSNYGFGVKVDKNFEGSWSFGSCISHSLGETYLFINFAVWSISIGWLMKGGTE